MITDWIIVAFVTLIALRIFLWKQVSASSDDWYVAFNINKSDKSVFIWFMPIVAFRIHKNNTTAITSNSHYLIKIFTPLVQNVFSKEEYSYQQNKKLLQL